MDAQNQLRDDILLVISYLAILLFALVIPPLFFLALVLLPIPVIVYADRYGRDRLLMMVGVLAISVFLCTFIFQTLLLIPMFVTSTASGLAIGLAIYKKRSSYETWIQGTIGFVIGLLFIFVFTQFVLEINWVDEIHQAIDSTLDNIIATVNQVDAGLVRQVEELIEPLKEQLYYTPNLIPVGIAMFSVVFALITQWLAYKAINKMNQRTFRFPPVRTLNFPIAIFWVYIIAFLISLFESDPSSGLYIGVQNIIALMSFLLVIQGFSFLFFFAHHRNQSNTLPIIAVIASFFIPFLFYIVRLVGLFDVALSLREKMQESKKG